MPIDELLSKYSDVPRSALLKYEFQRQGLEITDAALNAFQKVNTVFKGEFMFSWDAGTRKTLNQKVPFSFFFKRDHTYFINRTSDKSPYAIDHINGKFCIAEGKKVIEDIYFPPCPEYYALKTKEGVPRSSIVQSCGDLLFVTVTKYCEFWKDNSQCLFCDFMAVTKEQSKTGELGVVHRDPDDIGETVAMAFKEAAPIHRHLIISGGSILGNYQGLTEIDYYARVLDAIGKRLPVWFPSGIQLTPPNKEGWKRIKATGVSSVQPNMEVWGHDLFKKLCPGKEKTIGYDNYIKRILDGVDVFGPGLINPNFVIGVEMSKPHGFSSVDQAVENTLKGFEFLMQNGVFPRTAIWLIERGSALAGQPPAPLEYYVKFGRGYKELRHRYGFGDNLPCLCRGCNPQDPLHDWDWAEKMEKEKAKATVAAS